MLQRLFSMRLMGLVLCASLLIGGGISCGRGSTPPVSLPAPVENLISVSSPSTEGIAFITGAPGAVLGGATVQIQNLGPAENLSSTLINKPPLLLAKLHQVFVPNAGATTTKLQEVSLFTQVIAEDDGSFRAEISAEIEDRLEIIQFVDSEAGTSLIIEVPSGVATLETQPLSLLVDPATSLAYATSGTTGEFLLYALDLNLPLQSLPNPLLASAGPANSQSLSLHPLSSSLLSVSPNENLLVDVNLNNSSIVNTPISNPLSVSAFQINQRAIIGLARPEQSLANYSVNGQSIDCFFLIPTPTELLSSHIATPFVETYDTIGNNVVITVSLFGEDQWVLSRNQFDNCTTPGVTDIQRVLPQGITPSGFTVIDETQVLISDEIHHRVWWINLTTGEQASIPVGSSPAGIAYNASFHQAYVVNSGDNSVTSISIDDFSTQTQNGIGLTPTQIGLSPDLDLGVVLSETDGSLVTFPLF